MTRSSFAPGKIILSGEYAVVFGHTGIAVPTSIGMEVEFAEDPTAAHIDIHWEGTYGGEPWLQYAEKIVGLCQKKRVKLRGEVTIRSGLPLGKGMGSSTALLIAMTRAVLGDDAREEALLMEDHLNPGHSGLDFAVIWEDTPLLFRKGMNPEPVNLPPGILRGGILIDTGLPSEPTTELVAWMKEKLAAAGTRRPSSESLEALDIIARCSKRLMAGEDLSTVIRDHHKAQVALGVVPEEVQELIATIESAKGAAKVIGAGSRTGGAGIVLALGEAKTLEHIAAERSLPTMLLS
ncbi:MAG TPA: hypothetical protein VI873_03600 [Candidatus Peribacteraceae bacterium]|nr:hypothetical protein [Candidatus Peribacteraceae bacterium]